MPDPREGLHRLRAEVAKAVVGQDPAVTGVLIGGRVEFPVPILLGNSGLGIYGFMGGIGVNYQRDETPYAGSLTKALDWVKDQYGRTGQVMDPEGWTLARMPAVDRNVLRLGVWELLYADDVPDAVAVSEAMALVTDLSTDESPQFVNGILGSIVRNRQTSA